MRMGVHAALAAVHCFVRLQTLLSLERLHPDRPVAVARDDGAATRSMRHNFRSGPVHFLHEAVARLWLVARFGFRFLVANETDARKQACILFFGRGGSSSVVTTAILIHHVRVAIIRVLLTRVLLTAILIVKRAILEPKLVIPVRRGDAAEFLQVEHHAMGDSVGVNGQAAAVAAVGILQQVVHTPDPRVHEATQLDLLLLDVNLEQRHAAPRKGVKHEDDRSVIIHAHGLESAVPHPRVAAKLQEMKHAAGEVQVPQYDLS
mmetsp:Transcript_41210/g.105382  ORF Transcript_41210/g.105382 Transcript_41210/m.105382 type:complete len:262 (+) Transcript_41210:236-1021(+)